MERLGSALAVIFSGIFIVPILTVLTGAFGMIGIGLPVVAVLNLLGILHIPFNVLFITLTGMPQVFTGVIVGMIFIALSFLCGGLLKNTWLLPNERFNIGIKVANFIRLG